MKKSKLLKPIKNQRQALRVGLLGSTGKMGKALSKLVVEDADLGDQFTHVYSASGPNDPNFATLQKSDVNVVIDFSAPRSTLAMAKLCATLNLPLLVCTTGFNPDEMKQLERTLKKVPWAYTPNTSVGVFALKNILRTALVRLPADYKFEIIDVHHAHKKDAPSGTARMLLQEFEGSAHAVPAAVHSIRAGTEVGEHRILILGPDERLELSHHAQDRTLFARGALRLAAKLATLPARGSAYSVDDLFV